MLTCRLVGVIEGETIEDGEVQRNDRLIGVEINTHSFATVKTLKDLGDSFVSELEAFFENYHELSDHEYRVLNSRGPRVARDHVNEAIAKQKQRR